MNQAESEGFRRPMSPWKMEELKSVFNHCEYPDKNTCSNLADKLNLTNARVWGWFNHRRYANRLDKKDEGRMLPVRQTGILPWQVNILEKVFLVYQYPQDIIILRRHNIKGSAFCYGLIENVGVQLSYFLRHMAAGCQGKGCVICGGLAWREAVISIQGNVVISMRNPAATTLF